MYDVIKLLCMCTKFTAGVYRYATREMGQLGTAVNTVVKDLLMLFCPLKNKCLLNILK